MQKRVGDESVSAPVWVVRLAEKFVQVTVRFVRVEQRQNIHETDVVSIGERANLRVVRV